MLYPTLPLGIATSNDKNWGWLGSNPRPPRKVKTYKPLDQSQNCLIVNEAVLRFLWTVMKLAYSDLTWTSPWSEEQRTATVGVSNVSQIGPKPKRNETETEKESEPMFSAKDRNLNKKWPLVKKVHTGQNNSGGATLRSEPSATSLNVRAWTLRDRSYCLYGWTRTTGSMPLEACTWLVLVAGLLKIAAKVLAGAPFLEFLQ